MASAPSRSASANRVPPASHQSFRFVIPERCGTNAAVSMSAPTRCSSGTRDASAHRTGRRRPPVGLMRPRSIAAHVVLPAPFGPSRPQTWPCSTCEAQVIDCEHALAEALREAAYLDDRLAHRACGDERVVRRKATRGAYRDGPWTRPRRSQDELRVAPRARDAQRTRLYLAETPMPSSPLPGLDACACFVDRVVGSMWWHLRFPDRPSRSCPACGPATGRGRRSTARKRPGPRSPCRRRYRTKGVVLHELVHFALGLDSGLPHHGRTFARILLDATDEFCGADRASTLADSYRASTACTSARAPRAGPTDDSGTGGTSASASDAAGPARVAAPRPTANPSVVTGRFEGYERGRRSCGSPRPTARSRASTTASVWDVADA